MIFDKKVLTATKQLLKFILRISDCHRTISSTLNHLSIADSQVVANRAENKKILDHPGRVTLKTEELFVVLLSSTIREGDP